MRKLLVLLTIALAPIYMFGSHIVGADISYTCNGSNQYVVELAIYRDCSGIFLPGTQVVQFQSSSCGTPTYFAQLDQVYCEDMSSLCDLGTSTCNGGSVPGFERCIYRGTIDLPQACADWNVLWTNCCRNGASQNLVNPSTQEFYINALINNTPGICNNSVRSGNYPLPYSCVGQPTQWNNSFVEADGDSVFFRLVQPASVLGAPIAYNLPFSAAYPFPTSSGMLNFNGQTGDATFTPSTIGTYVVAIQAEEYRSGTLIGTSLRDFHYVTYNTGICQTNEADLDDIGLFISNGSMVSNGDTVVLCQGESFVFQFASYDTIINGDTVSISTNIEDIFPGSSDSMYFHGMNGERAIHVSGTVGASASGWHYLEVFATYNGCAYDPNNSYVLGIYVPETEVLQDTFEICQGQSIQLNAIGGIGYSWTPTVGLSDPNISNPVAFPPASIIYVVEGGGGICSTEDSVVVLVNPQHLDTLDVVMCPGDSLFVGGAWQYNSGQYFDTLQNANGCDTILTTNINIPVIMTGMFDDYELCVDSTLNVVVTGITNVSWSNGQIGSTVNSNCISPGGEDLLWFTGTMTTSPFCQVTDTAMVYCDSACVWPGDANSDGITDNFDVLNLGLAYGITETPRTSPGNSWEAHASRNWTNFFVNNANYKHADCDGSGIVDLLDTMAINTNYGLMHAKGNGVNGDRSTDPALFYAFPGDSTFAGDTLDIAVEFGRDTLPVSNLYGVAFTINFDVSLVEDVLYTSYNNSWIGTGLANRLSFDRTRINDGEIDVAITKIDQTAIASGFGEIMNLMIVMVDDISGKGNGLIEAASVFSFSKVRAIDGLGAELDVYLEEGEVSIYQDVVGISPVKDWVIEVYPNPSTGGFTVIHGLETERILIRDFSGRVVNEFQVLPEQSTTDISEMLARGIYSVEVYSQDGSVASESVMIY